MPAPKKPEADRRCALVSVRFTTAEKALLESVVGEPGISEFIRRLALASAKRRAKPPVDKLTA